MVRGDHVRTVWCSLVQSGAGRDGRCKVVRGDMSDSRCRLVQRGSFRCNTGIV